MIAEPDPGAAHPLATAGAARGGRSIAVRCRSCAAVRDSAPGEGKPIAHDVNWPRWQLAQRRPFYPCRSEVGLDTKASIEVRTVDAPPAAEIALIAFQLVQAELGAPAAVRAGWHLNVYSGPVLARSDSVRKRTIGTVQRAVKMLARAWTHERGNVEAWLLGSALGITGDGIRIRCLVFAAEQLR